MSEQKMLGVASEHRERATRTERGMGPPRVRV